ncbi:MAG: ABC transporter permease [Candidatus Saliniplasma sp.]
MILNGRTILMEFQKGWRGFMIFILIVVIVAGGMAQLFPAISETFEEDKLEGGDLVHLETEEDVIYLSWVRVDVAQEYVVIEDRASHMATSWEVNRTVENSTNIQRSEDDERYFAVIAIIDGERVPVGMTSTVERKDLLEEMMDTPYFRMFTAGRADLRMDEMEGFLSVEVFSWWILLVGVYLGYLSVKSITEDYEDSRMDIIFSTPLSRRQYIIEKFSALALFTLSMLVLSGLVLTVSVYSVGASEGLEFGTYFVSTVISWPMFLVIIAVSIFFAVLFKNSRAAVGAMFAVILVQYAFFMAGHMLESLEPILPLTIPYYWDYNAVLLDGVVHYWHPALLIVIAVSLIAGSIVLFEDSDIPV